MCARTRALVAITRFVGERVRIYAISHTDTLSESQSDNSRKSHGTHASQHPIHICVFVCVSVSVFVRVCVSERESARERERERVSVSLEVCVRVCVCVYLCVFVLPLPPPPPHQPVQPVRGFAHMMG